MAELADVVFRAIGLATISSWIAKNIIRIGKIKK